MTIRTAKLATISSLLLAVCITAQVSADPLPGEILKFQQLPLDNNTSIQPGAIYNGHDEWSTAFEQFDASGNFLGWGGKFMADDFSDKVSTPLTHVKWWGSYLGNNKQPIQHFLISLEADVPAGTGGTTFSYPGTPLLSQIVNVGPLSPGSGTFTETLQSPHPGAEDLYKYNAELSIPFPEQKDTVYWLKIVALVPNYPQPFQWGWHNRDYTATNLLFSTVPVPGEYDESFGTFVSPVYHFQDDAVQGNVNVSFNTTGTLTVQQNGSTPQNYIDNIDGPTGIGQYSKDLAFELYTVVPEPSSLSLLGLGALAMLRRRCRRVIAKTACAAAVVGAAAALPPSAQADPLPGEVLKFQQLPMDNQVIGPAIYNGHDERSIAYEQYNASGTFIGWQGGYMADDFADNFSTSIVHVKWWGSYINNFNTAGSVQKFLISFESDVPASGGVASHPGTPLLSQIVTAGALSPASGTFTEALVTAHPGAEDLYKYNAELAVPFPELKDTVYWLKIVALAPQSPVIAWGWHNRDYTQTNGLFSTVPVPGEYDEAFGTFVTPVYHFQDDAVVGGLIVTPTSGGGLALQQPGFSPQNYIDNVDGPTPIGNYSKDLAFELYTVVPEPSSLSLLGIGALAMLRRRARRAVVKTACVAAGVVAAAGLVPSAQADPLPGEQPKFKQLPIDNLAIGGAIFNGHDEMSSAFEQFDPNTGAFLGWQGGYMADDFADNLSSPIVHIKWWGSYPNGIVNGVQKFLIAFENDVPATPLLPSHPDISNPPLLSQIVTKAPSLSPGSGTFTEILETSHPGGEDLYRYNTELAIPFPEQAHTVYWMKIVALMPNFTPQEIWGWHDRDYTATNVLASPVPVPGEYDESFGTFATPVYHFQDDAVFGKINVTPSSIPNQPLVQQPDFFTQNYIDNIDGPTGIGAYSKDLAFELYTVVPEPTTLPLLAIGGLLALRRRRAA